MDTVLNNIKEKKIMEWIDVQPFHCHKRLDENTLVTKLRVLSDDKIHSELLMKFNHEELKFFFDHPIDHLPGMLEACGLRQCALALAHLVYDVPMDYMMVLDWIHIKLYNFGELNTRTIVKSKLIDIKHEKNRFSIILEGLMVQNDYPVMRMRGTLFAFSPNFGNRIRNKKFKLHELGERSGFQKPLIAELHVIIEKNEWNRAYDKILGALRKNDLRQYSVVPLYTTYDIGDTELRICFSFNDPSLIDKFITKEIRPINGIQSTRIRLTLDGEIFPKGVKALAQADDSLKSCHIFLKIEPTKDTQVWNNLRTLKDIGSVFPTWVFRDFYEYDRDITLRLMGNNEKVIKHYIKQYIKNMDGVIDCKVKFMSKVEKILDDDKLLNLAHQWIKTK